MHASRCNQSTPTANITATTANNSYNNTDNSNNNTDNYISMYKSRDRAPKILNYLIFPELFVYFWMSQFLGPSRPRAFLWAAIL